MRSNPPLLILNLGGFGAIELPAVESPEWGSLGVGAFFGVADLEYDLPPKFSRGNS